MNSGIGDDDESGCDVEAMIHCSDEKWGKMVADDRLAEAHNIRGQRDKKMGR